MFRLGLDAGVTISSHFAAYEYEGKTTPLCQILSAGFKAFPLFIIHIGLANAMATVIIQDNSDIIITVALGEEAAPLLSAPMGCFGTTLDGEGFFSIITTEK